MTNEERKKREASMDDKKFEVMRSNRYMFFDDMPHGKESSRTAQHEPKRAKIHWENNHQMVLKRKNPNAEESNGSNAPGLSLEQLRSHRWAILGQRPLGSSQAPGWPLSDVMLPGKGVAGQAGYAPPPWEDKIDYTETASYPCRRGNIPALGTMGGPTAIPQRVYSPLGGSFPEMRIPHPVIRWGPGVQRTEPNARPDERGGVNHRPGETLSTLPPPSPQSTLVGGEKGKNDPQ